MNGQVTIFSKNGTSSPHPADGGVAQKTSAVKAASYCDSTVTAPALLFAISK